MDCPLLELAERSGEEVRAILNILVESPYFYRTDNEDLFFFLRRHRSEFAQFYTALYDWTLMMDDKCARVYKSRWYNESVTEANRDVFDFRRRDECIAFMILLEFFEHRLEENSMTVEDKENLRFRLGDLLQYTHRRFAELFPDDAGEKYTEDYVRGAVLRQVMPKLERYRLVRRIRPPGDVRLQPGEMILEALPALYHYNANRLSRSVAGMDATGDDEPEPDAPPTPGADEEADDTE